MIIALWLCLTLTGSVASHFVEYMVDPTWEPEYPSGVGAFSAVAVSGDMVFVDQRNASNADPILVIDKTTGTLQFSFGSHAIGTVNGSYGSHGLSVQPANPAVRRQEDTIWVMDFFNNTVLSFSLKGELLGKAGRSGVPSADADKFDHVADAAFRNDSVFFSDGDGGANNRIERWAAASGKPERVEWVSPATPPSQRKVEEFMNPHSIAWHETSDLLIVADREHSRIALLHPDTGVEKQTFQCDAINLGPKGKPFGVRTLKMDSFWGENSQRDSVDLLFVAVANNPKDGKNQFVHILDITSLSETGSCKSLLQTLSFAVDDCNTPHLMGVDHQTGDVYLACVAEPGSNLLRLTPRKKQTLV